MQRAALVALVPLLALALAGCASTPAPSSSGMDGMSMAPGSSMAPSPSGQPVDSVTIRDFAFSPAPALVRSGMPVHFSNQGPSMHSVSIHDPATNSMVANQDLSAGQTLDVTFPHPGTYHLTCRFHASMATEVHAQ